jgi:hypothetical protein
MESLSEDLVVPVEGLTVLKAGPLKAGPSLTAPPVPLTRFVALQRRQSIQPQLLRRHRATRSRRAPLTSRHGVSPPHADAFLTRTRPP